MNARGAVEMSILPPVIFYFWKMVVKIYIHMTTRGFSVFWTIKDITKNIYFLPPEIEKHMVIEKKPSCYCIEITRSSHKNVFSHTRMYPGARVLGSM